MLLPLAVILPPGAAVFGSGFFRTRFVIHLHFRGVSLVFSPDPKCWRGQDRQCYLPIPVFGLIWGVIFLNEPVYANTLAGLAIILLSVTLVNRKTRPKTSQAVDESGQSKV